MPLKSLAAVSIAGAVVASGALSSPAASYVPDEPWYTYNASVVARDTVNLAAPNDRNDAYIYNANVDYRVQAGDVVSFYMDTQRSTSCRDSYPFVYVDVDGRGFASYDDATPCPGDTTSTQDDGRVSFTIRETGRIGYTLIYYYDTEDNGVGGVVDISDLRVNDEPIYFRECDPGECDPELVATPYGATLSKPRPCVVRTFAYHDAALEGQVASPRKRRFITSVDGRAKSDLTLRAGETGRDTIRVRPDTGKRMVTVRLSDGTVLDRIVVRTRRC